MTWELLDWEILDRLRETFLSGDKTAGPYWHTITDLECYDFTYGERIGWKWDAVLRELDVRGWRPPGCNAVTAARPEGPEANPVQHPTILDWGCGSGIAGRRVVAHFGVGNFSRLLLHDHSALALDFAEHHGRKAFAGLTVERADVRFLRGDEPIDVLVVSHVLNELDDIARAELTELCARAQSVLWVEPGTHEVSRTLGGWREQLRDTFQLVAPCPHQASCGMLRPGNERHWCHFFASPPAGIHADSGWVKFGQRAGIDLRSLPYSFLALGRPPSSVIRPPSSGFSRIIGEPRLYKGYAKIFNCDAGGVAGLMLQKRDAPELFKALKHGADCSLHHWTHENGRITRIEQPTTNKHE
ncbi:MAG TPA: small ribosomal subunit Rsm22 family protein [Lacunisphaera sp.]|nr:small ribosomal subunit Rsm22 family protein [Lacunisphaera sp.]